MPWKFNRRYQPASQPSNWDLALGWLSETELVFLRFNEQGICQSLRRCDESVPYSDVVCLDKWLHHHHHQHQAEKIVSNFYGSMAPIRLFDPFPAHTVTLTLILHIDFSVVWPQQGKHGPTGWWGSFPRQSSENRKCYTMTWLGERINCWFAIIAPRNRMQLVERRNFPGPSRGFHCFSEQLTGLDSIREGWHIGWGLIAEDLTNGGKFRFTLLDDRVWATFD